MATKPDSQNKMAVGEVGEAVEQLINTASALGSTTIDLSKKRLTQVPPEVLNLEQLEVHFRLLLLIRFLRVITMSLTSNCLLNKVNQVLVTSLSLVFPLYLIVFVFLLVFSFCIWREMPFLHCQKNCSIAYQT